MSGISNFIKSIFGYGGPKSPKAIDPSIVEYLVNDPTTNLYIPMQIPSPPHLLPFAVNGFSGEAWKKGDAKSRAGNCYITLCKSIEHVQKLLKEDPITNWAAVSTLNVYPDAGRMFNAYYDRSSLKFFWENVNGQTIYLVDSSDVIAHELGHALLDARRPDFWSVQSMEIWSFHEGWADINAMCLAMSFDAVLEKALAETGGDMRKSNMISKVAEQAGYAILGPGVSLRDGVNSFKYVEPESLPPEAAYNELASECHSFGRVMLGTWYEIFVGIYEQNLIGMKPVDALRSAKDTAHSYLVRAVKTAPRVAKYHEAVSKVMLALLQSDSSPYLPIFQKVLQDRNLIPAVKAMSGGNLKTMDIADEHLTHINNITLAVVPDRNTVKLVEIGALAQGVSEYDLSGVEIEVAADRLYLFGAQGEMIDEVSVTQQQAIMSAQACLFEIRRTKNIGPTAETMWEITDNKLVRTFIQ